jgi:hypothetical protein
MVDTSSFLTHRAWHDRFDVVVESLTQIRDILKGIAKNA